METPTGTKRGPFVPVGASNRDKKTHVPPLPLARLVVGPGTKATYYPGPKGCRDKWPGTKAYSVVVRAAAAESDAARDVAARQGETWACRGHGMFLERSKCWQHEKAALLMGYVL